MKHKITKSLVVLLSVMLSVATLTPPAQGQQAPPKGKVDLGLITPGATDIVSITVVGTDRNNTIRIRFRAMQYAAQSCAGGPAVCRHMVVSEHATPVERLAGDDAASLEFQGTGNPVRVIVESNSPSVRVVLQIKDGATGRLSICTFIPD